MGNYVVRKGCPSPHDSNTRLAVGNDTERVDNTRQQGHKGRESVSVAIGGEHCWFLSCLRSTTRCNSLQRSSPAWIAKSEQVINTDQENAGRLTTPSRAHATSSMSGVVHARSPKSFPSSHDTGTTALRLVSRTPHAHFARFSELHTHSMRESQMNNGMNDRESVQSYSDTGDGLRALRTPFSPREPSACDLSTVMRSMTRQSEAHCSKVRLYCLEIEKLFVAAT